MRGLKLNVLDAFLIAARSHPIRDAWIEITEDLQALQDELSHPIRDAWIEINTLWTVGTIEDVASHTGCVD